ncbi:DUF5677 domain-containing protein [Pseudomonas mandelii]|uniref:DUF5677 domain-containing protein n=1 Tax=Pseudomonas mandelii TaxID=75612 RepID=UPI003C726016
MQIEETKRLLDECANARSKITRQPGVIVGNTENPDRGLYLVNYANCLLNRQADIYDDAILLVQNKRYQSACVISRGMIETYAFAKYLVKEVAKILTTQEGAESVDKALDLVISFTNSSRFKQAEQKKLEKGVFKIEDFHFTEQTKNRFEHNLASSVHVMNALRDLFQDEMSHKRHKESSFELVYDALSEWVHPSQTSIFHNYTSETHMIQSSFGSIHLYNHAQYLCATALHFITDSMNLHRSAELLAAEITKRD